MVLEKTLGCPLDIKEVKPVNLKVNQHLGKIDDEAEAPIICPPDAKLTYWKRPRCWERLKAKGEGSDRELYGWLASLTQWT